MHKRGTFFRLEGKGKGNLKGPFKISQTDQPTVGICKRGTSMEGIWKGYLFCQK